MRTASVLTVALVALAAVSAVRAEDIGTHLTRSFFIFKELPLTVGNATAQGWSQFNISESGACDPVVGYLYAQNTDGSGPSRGSQTILSFTANGQLNGWGVRVWTSVLSSQLLSAGYWRATGNNDSSYDIVLTTRGDENIVCGSQVAPELIGTQLSIWGIQSIALNAADAVASGWMAGNCIPKMGIHHSYDLNAPGKSTWDMESLVPVQPMYDAVTNKLNAVLVNVPSVQLVEPFGEMEGPFLNSLFCGNWCANTGCTWKGATVWSTLHFHIVPIDSISCTGAPCVL